jgi:hypothetical protein
VTPEDYESFGGILLGFAEPRRIALSSTTVELYWGALADWTFEEFRSAANILFKKCDWMPTPKDFEDLRRSATERAGVDAWEMARRAARSAIALGRVRQDVTSGDALVDRAVATIGGYGAIALCETAWLHALERRFLQAYVEVREVAEIRAALPHFAARDALPARSAAGPSSVSAILSSQPRVVERGRAGEDNSGSSLA